MPLNVYQHDQVRRRFERTTARRRLASTYLFVGPEGVGKRTFAKWLAASLLCHSSATDELHACGGCESCALLAAGNHPDLLEVARPEGKTTLPIGLFIGDGEKRNREGLCHDIALKPFLGDRRVAIIDDADDLSIESANCLLKTLEEPPPRSLLLLVGTSISKQLPTIRSRCQVVRFAHLSNETVEQVLIEHGLLQEGEDAHALAAESGGSVSAALAARDQEARQFQETLVRQLSLPAFDPVRLAAEAVAFSSASGAEPSLKRARVAGLIDAAVGFYRNALIDAGSVELPQDAALRCLDRCLQAEAALARNANQATLVQAWLIGLWRAHRARQ